MARGYLSASAEGVRVYLRVSPGAKSTGLKGTYGECALKLAVAAPPEKGRANAEVERLLAVALGVGVSQVEVVRGGSSCDKVALVRGASGKRIGDALESLLGG